MAMTGKKAVATGNSKIVLWLLGATVCYQVLYQSFMLNMLRTDQNDVDQCDGGDVATSPRCMELKLFRSWHQAEADEWEGLAVDGYFGDMLSIKGNKSMESSKRQHSLTQKSPIVLSVSTLAPRKVSSGGKQSGTIILGSVAGNENWRPITEWGKGLEAIQGKLEERMAKLPSVRRAKAQQRQEEFDRLYNETLVAIRNRSTDSDWAKEVRSMQEHFQARAEKLAVAHRHSRPHKASAHKESSLLTKIMDLGREMCEQPHRRHRASCAMFLTNSSSSTNSSNATKALSFEQATAEFEQRMAQLHNASMDWSHQFSNKITAYMQELCADPARRDYKGCAQYISSTTLAHAAAQEVTTQAKRSSLRGASDAYLSRLSWTSVTSWQNSATKVKDRMSYGLKDLHFQKWQGKIPRVACIAAIPPGRDTLHRMKYFIHNFQLQSYEGPHQLVLVYRHTDEDVKTLVQTYADGVYIKAVASRDAEIPSTTAFRYGAWASAWAGDADVIARWNFEEWHHPDRLAMQIRALALSARPASVLSHWTYLGSNNGEDHIQSSDPGWAGSIVGESAWMQQHWMPSLQEEQGMLAGGLRHWIVEVNMPELLSVYVLPSATQNVTEAGVEKPPSTTESLMEPKEGDRLAAVCPANFDAGSHKEDVAGQIQETLGEQMGTVYHTLVERRAEVAHSLRSLCDEAVGEKDGERLKGLIEHAETIAGVQREIQEHFVVVDALFKAA